MSFAFAVIDQIRKEGQIFLMTSLKKDIQMLNEAIECEMVFANDVLSRSHWSFK